MFGGIGKGFKAGVPSEKINYSVGDKVRIDEPFDENYGVVGTILRCDNDDDSYLIEFECDTPFGPTKHTAWYHNSNDFVLANKPSKVHDYSIDRYCYHEWREDKWFTSKVYKTCKKCGTKAEDV